MPVIRKNVKIVLENKICKDCGKTYQPTGFHQYFFFVCKPVRGKSRDKVCEWCGKDFRDDSICNTRKYFGKQCSHLARNMQVAEY